ncbi:hypothetical protein [Pantoea sp. BAV 3049]|uniref:hypothetical protein n=1 Tax=Pantoea sp. BAV 3049 TaxID=2654188 RepID=UPI00131DCDF8|nr:hypothetical protein [Pantoea sp. BAV 3049]
MNHLGYLKSALPKKRERWSQDLNKILMSDSLKIGIPYDEDLNLLLLKYKKRSLSNESFGSDIFGLNALIKNLSSCSGNHKAKIYPLKNDFFSGECVIMENEIIGCAFIKRGRSSSKEGLWINGNKID